MFLGSWEPTSIAFRFLGQILFWPEADEVINTNGTQILSAILGGIMFSWGLVYWFLTDLLESNPAKVKQIILVSIVAWFVIDSVGSLLAGSWVNVIFNTGYLMMFVLPLRGVTQASAR